MIDIKDHIISYYKDKISEKVALKEFAPSNITINAVTYNPGIGDTTIINNLLFKDQNTRSHINIFAPSNHYQTILNYNEFKNSNIFNQNMPTFRTEVLEDYNLGSGHIIQKMRKFFGLEVLKKPKSFLQTGLLKTKNKIGIHLTTGFSAFELSRLNTNPRQIYKNNIEILQDFINKNSQYEFVEFGGESIGLQNCKDFTGKSLAVSIEELSTCEYFIGLNSGFMNLAACFDIKSIIIVNIPITSRDIILPVLKDIRIPDMNWLYPQNVHLHQDDETEMVPAFNYKNIQKALNGDVYPFWSEEYLDLIYD